MNEHILVVDDETEIADLIELCLQNEGFIVHKYYNGTEALQCSNMQHLDLAILDIMLPDINGLHICKMIREKKFFPIIMLTAKVDDNDKIAGLSIGADDYITKPFNPLELVARVKTQLRRYMMYNKEFHSDTPIENSIKNFDEIDIRGLSICKNTHECMLFDKMISLTPIEFDILYYLCKNKGTVISAEELFQKVWHEQYLDNSNNTVMAHIARLREKLQDNAKKPKFIKTVWGVGYKIE